jgi:dynein heavy chain
VQFLSHDIPLFEGIISDLFPGVALPSPDYGALEEALVSDLKKRNLQAVPWFIEKIIQVIKFDQVHSNIYFQLI